MPAIVGEEVFFSGGPSQWPRVESNELTHEPAGAGSVLAFGCGLNDVYSRRTTE
jgi:hypothetical protein